MRTASRARGVVPLRLTARTASAAAPCASGDGPSSTDVGVIIDRCSPFPRGWSLGQELGLDGLVLLLASAGMALFRGWMLSVGDEFVRRQAEWCGVERWAVLAQPWCRPCPSNDQYRCLSCSTEPPQVDAPVATTLPNHRVRRISGSAVLIVSVVRSARRNRSSRSSAGDVSRSQFTAVGPYLGLAAVRSGGCVDGALV